MLDPDRFLLDGHVALVIGDGAGTGGGTARLLSEAGARVVFADSDPERARHVASGIAAAGGEAVARVCQFEDEAEVSTTIEAALDSFGKLSLLVTSFQVHNVDYREDTGKFGKTRRRASTHVSRLCKRASAHLAAAGEGAIVNISPAFGTFAQPFKRPASNTAEIRRLTRSLVCDFGYMGVRVNAIVHGVIETDPLAASMKSDQRRDLRRQNPLGRLGRVEDVAYSALFLCASASSWITGEIILVTGGAELPSL